MQDLAPIVLFIYNRPNHLRACLTSLFENKEIVDSELYIFADGPKNNAIEAELAKIKEVRNIAAEKKWGNKVHIIEKNENMGLAEAIIQGVRHVLDIHGKAIVLEDDLILGKHFLKYMNDALNKYEHENNVAQVSGFLFPIKTMKKQESFFMPLTTTLGWGTWKRVWNSVDFYPTDYTMLGQDVKLKKQFDLDGCYSYTKMMYQQMKNPNYGSWGVRFWWHVFKAQSMVIYPDYPMLQHRDKDLSGTHKANYDFLNQNNWDTNYIIKHFPKAVKSDDIYFGQIKSFVKFNNSLLGKVLRYINKPKNILLKIRNIQIKSK